MGDTEKDIYAEVRADYHTDGFTCLQPPCRHC